MTLVLSPSEIVSKLEKNSELGLLGKAPKWNRRLLGELIDVQNGAPFSSDKFNREGLGMPLIRIRDVGASETSTYFNGEYHPAYVVRAGDLLVGMDGDFRCAKWTSGDALLNQRVCRLKVISAELDERFLFLILQGYLDAIWKETSATTVKHLSSKSIQEIPIPLPSIKEQQKIVEILEDHLSRLDAALADVKQAKLKAAQFRRSLLQAAFTGNLSGDGTRLMKPVTEWKKTKLVNVVDAAWGDTSKTKASYVDAGFTAFSAAGPDGFLDYFDYDQEGIVLSAIGANCGKVYFASGKWSCIKNTMRFLVKDEGELSIKFLFYALSNPNAFVRRGSGQPFIRQQDVREMEISYPPLPEQHKIVDVLEDHLSRLDASVAIADAMEKQSASLRRSLLQAAFTGQLTKEVASV